MRNDTSWLPELPEVPHASSALVPLLHQASRDLVVTGRGRGRPPVLKVMHLGLAVLWGVLHGWQKQRRIWRMIVSTPIGPFEPVQVSDQAIYNRLEEQGAATMQALFEQMTSWLRQWLTPYAQVMLAPFASDVYSVDESKLDQVCRWLKGLWGVKAGDQALVPGRLCGLFDVRRQLWARLDLLQDASANSLEHARCMLHSITKGALLLFDRGYYSFEWFDDLTRTGIWWISRLRKRGSYVVQHVFVHTQEYVDQLVYLGAYRSDHASTLMRLVQFRWHGNWYSYLTNVLDPRTLPASQIVRLYARRWDIEMAFRLLKDYLGLRRLWSAKWEVIAAQVWACALLAQFFHAFQVRLAAEAEVDVFEVSLSVLIEQVSQRVQHTDVSMPTLLCDLARVGRQIGLIRPSSRRTIEVPELPWHWYCWPDPAVLHDRPPRYAHRPAGNLDRKKPAVDSA